MKIKKLNFFLFSSITVLTVSLAFAEDASYIEPGSVRISHDLTLEGVFHRVSSGWKVENETLNKSYSKQPGSNPPWTTEWGQTLLTEVATRVTPDFFGRILFEAQGDYADRFWRPININHHIDNQDRNVFFRQAEGRIDKDSWFAHAFSGVGHESWEVKGDLFALYPASYPNDDYLRHSGFFGIYPKKYNQDLFLNISRRHVPQGIEAGATIFGLDTGFAYGDELAWGYDTSYYGRASSRIQSTKWTFVYKDEDVPYSPYKNEDERNRAYALSLSYPVTEEPWLDAGILYQPFRVGDTYKVADDVGAGNGLLGSAYAITEKKSKKEDGIAGRLRLIRKELLGARTLYWSLDLTRAGILAGNKEEASASVGTEILPVLTGKVQFTYRRPLEGPIPFLYEGTLQNMGAIAANPRGPESPFTVNWQNREASIVTTSFIFDPTPATTFLIYNPDTLSMWNINPGEDARLVVAAQFKLTDYKTTTDRQVYYNEVGDIIYESVGHTGAWATGHPLPEAKIMLYGTMAPMNWALGFAGGRSPAQSSLAYSEDTTELKPLTDFYAFEGRVQRWPFTLWAHYGWGVWGPEPFQYFFGESYDQLFGLGLSYNINVNTTVDVNYMAARQDDDLFVAPDLGTYDEIRFLFSHRFGFLFHFEEEPKPGFRAR
jgi:hypothetical protein